MWATQPARSDKTGQHLGVVSPRTGERASCCCKLGGTTHGVVAKVSRPVGRDGSSERVLSAFQSEQLLMLGFRGGCLRSGLCLGPGDASSLGEGDREGTPWLGG